MYIRRWQTVLCAMLFLLCVLSSQARLRHVLPRPQSAELTGGKAFKMGRAVALDDPTQCWYLGKVLSDYGCAIKAKAKARIVVRMTKSIEGAFNHIVEGFPDEAYRLSVGAGSILIEAISPTGVIRAAQTLQQLAEGYDGRASIEALRMSDYPSFKVRGMMHDVGRSFISIDELKREIDLLARFKMSVFHWHLTENQAWRFEVRAFPQLTSAASMTRFAGQYYTQDECRHLEQYAAQRGITIIPEIDMPGHSAAFERAMGFGMQTEKGIDVLKKILDEVVQTFTLAPYIHIGGDEVRIDDPDYLRMMADYVRQKGRHVVVWNRLVAGAPTSAECDMTQMWATAGRAVEGIPNIDCRYNYTNHFDVYADLVGIFKSNIYYAGRGTKEVAGTISAAWNDTRLDTEADIIRQNNIYPNVIASLERAWTGGGRQYIEQGGTTLPNDGAEYEEFADFERRLLFHKAHSLKDVPMAYVRQSNVRWRISDPFPNGGDKAAVFPPETCSDDILPTEFTYNGQVYGSRLATGAGIYLRHIWHPIVPSFYPDPHRGQTAYAWTYVYSPRKQQAGAQIEFYTYSRSGNEYAPKAGCWDRRGSMIWLNGEPIPAPQWEQTDTVIPQDDALHGLRNENLTARPIVSLTLRKGWNKVLLRLPYADNGGTKREKWQFTFVLTTPDGRNALDGIVYSPEKRR